MLVFLQLCPALPALWNGYTVYVNQTSLYAPKSAADTIDQLHKQSLPGNHLVTLRRLKPDVQHPRWCDVPNVLSNTTEHN